MGRLTLDGPRESPGEVTAFLASAAGCLWRERRASALAIARFQETRLRALLLHAKETTPFWRERLLGVDPGSADLARAFGRIAPVGKNELMARFDDTIAGGGLSRDEAEAFARDRSRVGTLHRGRYVIATTSGTTGRVGYFVSDARAFAAQTGALFARILRHRLVPHEILRFCFGRRYRMAMTIATEGHFITRLVSSYRPWLTRALVNMASFSVMDPIEATIAGLNRMRPHYVHGYPTYIEVLAAAQARGALAIAPEFISLGSEPVSRTALVAIRSAFPGAEISETYGTTECLTMANQCRFGGLHVNSDLCVLEPVDARGHPVPPGVPSDRVLVTNLTNFAQPLIRYEIHDSVTVLEGACACGAAFPRIRVEGRADDTFFFEDAHGRWQAHPPVPFEVLFLDLEGLEQYQLVHESQNHLRVRFVPKRGESAPRLESELVRRFETYLGARGLASTVRLLVEGVEAIEREPGGHKLRQVYSKVPRPGDASLSPRGA